MSSPMDNQPSSSQKAPRLRFTNVATAPRKLYHTASFIRISDSEKIEEYIQLAQRIILPTNPNADSELKIIVKSLIDLDISFLHISANLLVEFWSVTFKQMPVELLISVSEYAIEEINKKPIFVQIEALMRRMLAEAYENKGRYRDAALALIKVPLEAPRSTFTNDHKIDIYLYIVQLLYSGGFTTTALGYLAKIRALLKVHDDESKKHHFLVLAARGLDYKCNYFEATRLLHRLIESDIDRHKDIIIRLSAACPFLLPMCLWRMDFMAKMYNDQRYHGVIPQAILKKFKEYEVIYPEDFKAIEKILMPHHKFTTYDRVPILQYFTCEHNLVSISRANSSVKLEELETLLNVKPAVVEQVAAKMISTKRLRAKIENGFIYFSPPM